MYRANMFHFWAIWFLEEKEQKGESQSKIIRFMHHTQGIKCKRNGGPFLSTLLPPSPTLQHKIPQESHPSQCPLPDRLIIIYHRSEVVVCGLLNCPDILEIFFVDKEDEAYWPLISSGRSH